MNQIFGNDLVYNRYLTEGARCRSAGVLSTWSHTCFVKKQLNGRERLVFRAGMNRRFDAAVTASGALPNLKACHPNERVLIVVGVARAWAGFREDFWPRRCYLLVLNVVIPDYY